MMLDGMEMIQKAIGQISAGAILDNFDWDAVRDGYIRSMKYDLSPEFLRAYSKQRLFRTVAAFQPTR